MRTWEQKIKWKQLDIFIIITKRENKKWSCQMFSESEHAVCFSCGWLYKIVDSVQLHVDNPLFNVLLTLFYDWLFLFACLHNYSHLFPWWRDLFYSFCLLPVKMDKLLAQFLKKWRVPFSQLLLFIARMKSMLYFCFFFFFV